jgi:hypothetical protein
MSSFGGAEVVATAVEESAFEAWFDKLVARRRSARALR